MYQSILSVQRAIPASNVLSWFLCFGYALFAMTLSLASFCQISKGLVSTPNFLYKLKPLQPFCLVNYYGLFGRMTTYRYEVIVEGSMDGNEWKTYEFKYKPGDCGRAPSFVTGIKFLLSL